MLIVRHPVSSRRHSGGSPLNDYKKSTVLLTQVEINRQIALKHVRLNPVQGEAKGVDTYRGPVVGNLRKVLSYVVHENHCCFAFQPFYLDPTPSQATPLSFYEEDFEKKFKCLEKMYLKFANNYNTRVSEI
jgi:hypothetical protein